MKCPHCGLNLPDDSEFCQYCGNKLKIETPVPEEIPARRTVRVQPVPSVRPRSVHPAPANPACEPRQTSAVEKCAESAASTSQKSAGQWVVICLVLALLVSLAVNGIQYEHSQELEKTVSAQGDIVQSQKQELTEYKEKADSFDALCAELEHGNIGRASEGFYASEHVLVVSKDTKDRKFTLVTEGPETRNIEVQYSSTAAYIQFDEETWVGSTTITVQPRKLGVNVVTFLDTVTEESFKVLILVTE